MGQIVEKRLLEKHQTDVQQPLLGQAPVDTYKTTSALNQGQNVTTKLSSMNAHPMLIPPKDDAYLYGMAGGRNAVPVIMVMILSYFS